MTARETRLGLLAFLLLAAGLAVNLLFLQSVQHVKTRARAAADAETGEQERARRLALPAGDATSAAQMTPKLLNATPVPQGAVQPFTGAPVVPSSGLSSGPRAEADSIETVKAIQRELQLKGYQPGSADGVPGLMTRAAIMAYEHDHAMQLTGEANDRLLKAILLGASAARGGAPAEPAQGAQSVIRTVQQSLSGLGYNTGRVDGRLGEDTVRAIRDFETDNQLPETGRISGALIARLAKGSGSARGAAR